MRSRMVMVVLALLLTGCGTMFRPDGSFGSTNPVGRPPSPGESESGYTYVPIDPFPVSITPGSSCKSNESTVSGPLLDSLPDNAVRMLVEKFDVTGGVTYGVSKAGVAGESYRVTVDYINADTINVQMWIGKFMQRGEDLRYPVDLFNTPSDPQIVPGTETYMISRSLPIGEHRGFYTEFNIPVYVGVGLRVSANVYVVGASANISGIGVIGAEAEAERLRGSLVVQTLGINGKSIAAALPIQSELNRTTAQNAIVAVGSIKALLYSDETITSPRVVGIYLPFPGGKPLVNALISELSKERVVWYKPCLQNRARGSAPDSSI